MSAIATGGDTASFGWRTGCSGGSCSGVVAPVGCCGGYVTAPVGCCGGYVAAPVGCCGGCGGRSIFPLFPGLRARLTSRVSGCYGSSCYGSSCQGSAVYYGTSCYGSAPVVGSGCTGSYYAPTIGYGAPAGFGGCFGSSIGPGYLGASFPAAPVAYGAPAVYRDAQPLTDVRPAVVDFVASRATPTQAAPARLTIELPADAVLYVDGAKVAGTGAVRNFHTPSLPEGTFYYDLKAVVKVDGEAVTQTKQVLVKAGDAKTETFDTLIAAVKAGKPTVVSK